MANRDEVEEFLRRAAARRAAAQQPQQRPPAQPPQGWSPPPAPPRPQQPLSQQRFPQPERRPASLSEVVMLQPVELVEPVEAEVVDAELAEQPDRLGKYVARDMRGTQEIAEHASHLGEEVDQADDKIAARLHKVFDHSLGSLKKQATDSVIQATEGPSDQGPALSAGSIAQLMRSPLAVRNAIILGEILHRPEERW